jgi:phenylalanyl-tRNA synthetase beta chain
MAKSGNFSSGDLMICDAGNPLCIAGIFGGMNSGITDKTKNVLSRAPVFLPKPYANPFAIMICTPMHPSVLSAETDISYDAVRH